MPNFGTLGVSLKAELQEYDDDPQGAKTPELVNGEDESDEEDVLTQEEKWQQYWTSVEDQRLQKLILCQSCIRRWLTIKHYKQMKEQLYSTCIQDSTVQLQAHIRGCLVRFRLGQRRQLYTESITWIWKFQAICRRYLVQKKLSAKANHYLNNMDKVIKVQQHVRKRCLNRKYEKLEVDNNPTIDTVQTFVHLLDDSELDFDSEINLEEMRQQVIERIQENNHLDAHINSLDIQIALFLRNATTMEEVMKHSGALKKKKQRILKQQAMKGPSRSDPHSLNGMDKASRERLELYQHLIYLLQTEPKYLARLLSALTLHQVVGRHTIYPLIESTVLSLFGYTTNAREEYLMINLCKYCIAEEIKGAHNVQDFLRGNYAFMKLIVQTNRGAKERRFFKKLVRPLVTMVIENKELDLETDPISIYQKVINEEESATGRPTSRPSSVTAQGALADKEVRNRFISHLRNVRETTETFLTAIISSIDDVPYGIRVIARELRLTLENTFPSESREQITKIIGHFIYYRYMNPAIIAPEQYDVVDAVINPVQRRNLAEVSKMLQYISSGQVFDKAEYFISPLNDYVLEAGDRFANWFMEVTEVESPEAYFDMDTLTDHTNTRKPMVYMTPMELFHLHYVLENNMDILEPGVKDVTIRRNEGGTPLSDLLTSLGPSSFGPDQTIPNDITVRLTLTSHRDDLPVDSATWLRQAIFDTKRLVVYVIKHQSGPTLLDILQAPVEQEHESNWEKFKQIEFLGTTADDNDNKSTFNNSKTMMAAKRRLLQLIASETALDLYCCTFEQLKQLAYRFVVHLERCNVINSTKGYQDVINMIARDITGKNARRQKRTREVSRMKSILAHLQTKCDYLLEQGNQYEDYLNGCMTAMANKTSKNNKKTPLLFSRQYFHIREIQKSGFAVPRFGSYRYTAKQLHDRGILVNIDYPGIKKTRYDRIAMVFSMDQAGLIAVEARYAKWTKNKSVTPAGAVISDSTSSVNLMSPSISSTGIYTVNPTTNMMMGLRVDLRYEDLLQAQFEGTQMITLLDDAVKVNLNLLIYFINKKFYS
ncbi:Rho GTPase activation protein [Halteromyces radiatus]|uniref:Rho GTPase activation protein n=1 Tax=Halteromyces radiatus TaxID=101107 RepID=UPI00221F0D20|nr:Rho GTPase activation protein [Halteromyces radiatus]KAI8100025.1 Rho GTPase activation protein [Halteromyces radiatus]